MTNFIVARNGLRRSLAALAGSLVLPVIVGCGSGTDAGDGDSTAGNPSSGGSAGTSSRGGSGGDGTGGSAGSGFACTSDAEPGALVTVPAGEFIMGCNGAVDTECLEDEMPMHVVSLAAFEIELTEVTQDAYAACVTAGACDPPSCAWDCDVQDLPATCVNFEQAKAYCAWADRRLPTEAEWEKAARGSDGLKFPWGNEEPSCTLVNMIRCGDAATPVGSFPAGASPYGALDMAGNMVEMVSDWYDETYYQASPSVDPQGPPTGNRYSGRGGGWRSEATWHRASKRDWYDAADAGASLGFRCAR